MGIIGIIFGLISFVCLILVLVKMFQKAGVGIGIVGIITCGIGAYIWGWVKSRELKLTKIMIIWTIAIIVGTVANTISTASAIQNNPEFQKAMQQAIEDAQKAGEEAQKAAEEAAKTVPAQ